MIEYNRPFSGCVLHAPCFMLHASCPWIQFANSRSPPNGISGAVRPRNQDQAGPKAAVPPTSVQHHNATSMIRRPTRSTRRPVSYRKTAKAGQALTACSAIRQQRHPPQDSCASKNFCRLPLRLLRVGKACSGLATT